ncbi:TetR family transcriptional regulator [Sulfobacillus sp. DSM 109850]|uniref:TetR family transcriptional regulator n=2 Tax=Sulfobacillus harzensis TaxID=2729629 RepID=A0A7Y0Q489_9FIRM|nr:TetR family transcriptional regulator [Sulfobacillus harzensis]
MRKTRERADAARNRQAILDAALALFAANQDPAVLTMDAVAKAAAVGKGTLFRRFGDRASLLRAVFDAQVDKLADAIDAGPPPLGPATPPAERVPAILEAIVALKLANRTLTHAVEAITPKAEGTGPFVSVRHAWIEERLEQLLGELIPRPHVPFTAHALLNTTRIDLLDYLTARQGLSHDEIRREFRHFVQRVLT